MCFYLVSRGLPTAACSGKQERRRFLTAIDIIGRFSFSDIQRLRVSADCTVDADAARMLRVRSAGNGRLTSNTHTVIIRWEANSSHHHKQQHLFYMNQRKSQTICEVSEWILLHNKIKMKYSHANAHLCEREYFIKTISKFWCSL